MGCLDTDKLVRYDEGDLPAAEAAAAARHIASCAACRNRFDAVKQSWKSLELLEAAPLPAAAYRDIPRQALRAGTARLYRISIYAAAAVLLASFGLAMASRQWRHRSDTPNETPVATVAQSQPTDHAASATPPDDTRQAVAIALPPRETPAVAAEEDTDPWQDAEVLAALEIWEAHPGLTAEQLAEKTEAAERDLALLQVLFEE